MTRCRSSRTSVFGYQPGKTKLTVCFLSCFMFLWSILLKTGSVTNVQLAETQSSLWYHVMKSCMPNLPEIKQKYLTFKYYLMERQKCHEWYHSIGILSLYNFSVFYTFKKDFQVPTLGSLLPLSKTIYLSFWRFHVCRTGIGIAFRQYL